MASIPLIPVITDAGLNAAFNASNTSLAANITHIALGDAAYTPATNRTALGHELMRVAIADGVAISPTQVHLTALASSPTPFWVKEIGFYMADGTLFAVWSDPAQALAYKAANVDLLLAFDLSLAAVPPNSITVQGTGQSLNLYYAEEFASLAAASINNMARDLKQLDMSRAHDGRIAALEIGNHQQFGELADLRRRADDALLAVIANAIAMLTVQKIELQRSVL